MGQPHKLSIFLTGPQDLISLSLYDKNSITNYPVSKKSKVMTNYAVILPDKSKLYNFLVLWGWTTWSRHTKVPPLALSEKNTKTFLNSLADRKREKKRDRTRTIDSTCGYSTFCKGHFKKLQTYNFAPLEESLLRSYNI